MNAFANCNRFGKIFLAVLFTILLLLICVVRRWNLWFPSAGVFAKVLAGRATGTQITFPPRRLPYCEDETRVHALIDSQLLEARQNFTATSLSLLRNHRKRQQLTALLKSLSTIKTLVSHFLFSLS